ncbi:MAG: protein kinase [Firmicutes bacterium]|nr:protein kinase [Bacillota bacterium]
MTAGSSIQRDSQIVGMALLRGLLDEAALHHAFELGGNLLEALKAQGSLDDDDVRDLAGLVDEEKTIGLGTSDLEERTQQELQLLVEGRGLWDSLPQFPSSEDDGAAKQVLKVLSLPSWKQYRALRFIAEGGMGRVFKAFDPRLNRMVALKFLRRDGQESHARFMLEAQSQAKVEHPNICRVYEVGEWQQQCYIAMQFIPGETLDAMAPKLSLEQRAQVMEIVAEAVHAAHHHGLIHRDLKPVNILVQMEERGPKPTILDFGLAKGLEETGFTLQGQVVGTTHYMAPEQAVGDHAQVGRRTDVYGLGATLHKVLTGQAPFAEYNGLEALRCTLEKELPSLCRLVPDLPEDLDTITRKCLEKDPARRYESALAVAEDLRRWREGEPILAHRPTLRYRLGKWVRKHRLLVATALVVLVAMLGLGAYAGGLTRSARAQARHAQHFGQEAERIEALLRYAHLAPRHDIRPELTQVKGRLEAMQREAQSAGRKAQAPAAYAMGRAYLALGDAARAKTHLERAWNEGYRSPDLSLALGRALAMNYREALDMAGALPTKEAREAREKELSHQLRDPALALLREGASASLEAPAFYEALLAAMEQRWIDVETLADEALKRTPWLFEAAALKGQAFLARAKAHGDPVQVFALLDEAEAALAQARTLGPSDPTVAILEVRALAQRVQLERQAGRSADGTLANCREAVGRAQEIRPDGGEALALLAQALGVGIDYGKADVDWKALLEIGHLTEKAMELEPEHPTVLLARLKAMQSVSYRERGKGGDFAMPAFDKALALAYRGQSLHPQNPLFPLQIMEICSQKLISESNSGQSPWATFEEGLKVALDLRRRYPELPDAFRRIVCLWIERAEHERTHGLDPRPSLEIAQSAANEGLSIGMPRWMLASLLGDIHLIRGQYLQALESGGDEEFRQSMASYGYRDDQGWRGTRTAESSSTEALLALTKARMGRGEDCGSTLEQAERLLGRADYKEMGYTLAMWGRLAHLKACRALAQGSDPRPHWAEASRWFQKALGQGKYTFFWVDWAEAASQAYAHGGQARDRAEAIKAIHQALAQDPTRAEAWLWLALLERERGHRGDKSAEARSAHALHKALMLDSKLIRTAKQVGLDP